MATRCTIARPVPWPTFADTVSDTPPAAWEGVYGAHAMGYPDAAGRIIYAQVMTVFGGDAQAAAEHYIDRHPGGFRSLDDDFARNDCYCHDRAAGSGPAAPDMPAHSTDEFHQPWVYLLEPLGLRILRFGTRHHGFVPWGTAVTDWSEYENDPAPTRDPAPKPGDGHGKS